MDSITFRFLYHYQLHLQIILNKLSQHRKINIIKIKERCGVNFYQPLPLNQKKEEMYPISVFALTKGRIIRPLQK